MLLTLGLTGMDQATEASLKAAFSEANARLGQWMLHTEADAEYVIVDMDSMYGPMSWLRLHAAGKRVVGLTSAPRTQADFRLGRPFDGYQMGLLLSEIVHNAEGGTTPGTTQHPASDASTAAPGTTTSAFTLASSPTLLPEGTSETIGTDSIPVSMMTAPEPPAAITLTANTPPSAAPPAVQAKDDNATLQAATLQSAPAPVQPEAAAVPVATKPEVDAEMQSGPGNNEEQESALPRGAAFADWLKAGALTGRARYQSGKGPELFIDFMQRQYYGPATLKPLCEYFVTSVGLRDFEQLDDQAWQTAIRTLGAAQQLSRLQWLGGLLAGEGRLLPGYNPDGKFLLNKWPETEREYPRHFRIATAMMKGPMTIAEIAAGSGIPVTDVIDFINANLATGFAEAASDAPPPVDAAKPSSLLDRLRGR